MSALSLSLASRESQKLTFAFTNVPQNAVAMRLLVVNNETGNMITIPVPVPQGLSRDGMVDVSSLPNGVEHDAILTAYGAQFVKLADSNRVNDSVPASAPPAIAIRGLANRDNGLFNIEVDFGAFPGTEITFCDVHLYDRTADNLNSVRVPIVSGTLTLTQRIGVLDLTGSNAGLNVDHLYSITGSASNDIGIGSLSEPFSLLVKNKPDAPALVQLTNVDNVLVASWTKGNDVELFSNMQHDISFEMQWMEGAVQRSSSFKHDLVALTPEPPRYDPITLIALPALKKYKNEQSISTQFSATEIAQIVSQMGIQSVKQLSVVCKVKSVNVNLESTQTSSNALSFLNVPESLSGQIRDLLTFGSSASRTPNANVVFSASMSQVNNDSLRQIAKVSTAVNAASWFSKIVFDGFYNQKDSQGVAVKTPINMTMPITVLSQNASAVLQSSLYAPADNLTMTMRLEDNSGARSALFQLPAQSPPLASILIEKETSECKEGLATVAFRYSQGNANNVVANITLKKVNAAPITAFTSSALAPTQISGRAGWFSVSTGFGSLQQGDLVEVLLSLSDDRGPNSRVPFYTQSVADVVTFVNQNYSALLQQGASGIVTMIADKELNPLGSAQYAHFAGLSLSAYAAAQGSNVDTGSPALGSEVTFSIVGGAIVASLSQSSATYRRFSDNANLSALPVSLTVSITGCDRLEAADAVELALVKNLSGSSLNLSQYFWVKCIGTYAPGQVTLNTSASRTINGIPYKSDGFLITQLVDAAAVESSQTTKKAIALKINLNGSSAVSLYIQGVPVYNPSVIALPEKRATVSSADLNARGYYVVRFDVECSAFVYAMSTNGSTSNSLNVAVAQAVDVPSTSEIPALPVAPVL